MTTQFKRVMVLGASGMLGTQMVSTLLRAGHDVIGYARTDLDITQKEAVEAEIVACSPQWVINCAAYTAVDSCETSTELATLINGVGPGYLAQVCYKYRIPLVHFSTDYVFDGTKEGAYVETDPTCPINAYGRSKLAGETAVLSFPIHYVFRIQWLYGHWGSHFIRTVLTKATTELQLSVVNDQWGSPTSTQTISDAMAALLNRPMVPGLYHLAAQGYASWFELAQHVFKQQGVTCHVVPVSSDQFPRPAKRPKNSRLKCSKFLRASSFAPLTWQSDVDRYLQSGLS